MDLTLSRGHVTDQTKCIQNGICHCE